MDLWACYTDQNMVNFRKSETKKSSKGNVNIIISKDDCGKLSWDQKHVLVLDFLVHGNTVLSVIVVRLAYAGPFFAKGLGYFNKLLSFCMQMPGIMHPTGLTAATSDRLWISPKLALSVLSLTEP